MMVISFLFIVIESAPVDFILRSATGIARLGLEKDYLSNDSSANGGTIRIRREMIQIPVSEGRSNGKTLKKLLEVWLTSLVIIWDYQICKYGPPFARIGTRPRVSGYWLLGINGHGNRGWNEVGGPNPFCVWSLAQLGWLGESNKI